ncbi:hypothetical protein Hanom_Chr02g00097071 [Helianthus anomalus]
MIYLLHIFFFQTTTPNIQANKDWPTTTSKQLQSNHFPFVHIYIQQFDLYFIYM